MAKTVKLKRGFDINLVGKPEKKLADIPQSETFAVKPTDFPHIIQPKILVREGIGHARENDHKFVVCIDSFGRDCCHVRGFAALNVADDQRSRSKLRSARVIK